MLGPSCCTPAWHAALPSLPLFSCLAMWGPPSPVCPQPPPRPFPTSTLCEEPHFTGRHVEAQRGEAPQSFDSLHSLLSSSFSRLWVISCAVLAFSVSGFSFFSHILLSPFLFLLVLPVLTPLCSGHVWVCEHLEVVEHIGLNKYVLISGLLGMGALGRAGL